jgi:hypothetical protein
MEIAKSARCIPGRRKVFPNSTFTSAYPTSESILGIMAIATDCRSSKLWLLDAGMAWHLFAASPFEY